MFPSLMVCAVVAIAADASRVEIIAHRGESADAPENTLAAFRLAWERKVDAIELDVHLTADDQLVVCHDYNTKRTTGVDRELRKHPWSDLQGLDAGKWKGEKFVGEPLPHLDDALATIPAGSRCFVEVKVGPEAIPPLVKAVAKSGKKPSQLAIISFNADTIAAAKQQLPHIKAYFLTSFKRDRATGEWTPNAEQLIAQAKKLGADGVDVAFNGPLDEAFVRQLKEAKLELYVWTVNDAEVAQRLAALGVDGITTDRGQWLTEILRGKP